MEIEVKSDRVTIDGYVNAAGRESRPIFTADGKCTEIIEPGAFRKALERAENVKLLLNHEQGNVYASTAGGTLKLAEDNIGLKAHAEITDPVLIEKARSGELRGWSFGMYVNERELEERADGKKVRHVTDLDIFEVTLVDKRKIPCYAATSVECRADSENYAEIRSNEEETDIRLCELSAEPDYSKWENKVNELRAQGEIAAAEARLAALRARGQILEAKLRLAELRYNPYHDPRNGRFTSGKVVDKTEKNGIIKVGGEGMYRKNAADNVEPMPKKQFRAIKKAFQQKGGIIQQNDETDEYLNKNNAEGVTYNAETILLKQNPGRACVFEELIHSAQYKAGKNDGSKKSRILNEIEAQKKLLKHAKEYKLTKQEIIQTQKALNRYQEDLKTYNKLNGGG